MSIAIRLNGSLITGSGMSGACQSDFMFRELLAHHTSFAKFGHIYIL